MLGGRSSWRQDKGVRPALPCAQGYDRPLPSPTKLRESLTPYGTTCRGTRASRSTVLLSSPRVYSGVGVGSSLRGGAHPPWYPRLIHLEMYTGLHCFDTTPPQRLR